MLNNQTYQRLLPIINMIDKSIICQTLTDNGNSTYTFLCSYTKWLVDGYTITIGLHDYLITEFVCNESITVSGTILPTQLTFDLYAPIFKHGTITKVSQELNSTLDFKNKLPLIFLHEIVEEKYNFDKQSSIDTDADVRLYFLTGCNIADWTQLQGDTNGVQPMRNLCREFIKVLSDNQYVAALSGTGNVKNYNIFGNVDDKGTTKYIFNEFLSGVQLKITIPFLKDCDCCEGNNLDNRPAPSYVYDVLGNILAVLYSNEFYIATSATCIDVLIKNIDTGATITSVASGGTYFVEQLTVIKDTVFNNTTTIIDPII